MLSIRNKLCLRDVMHSKAQLFEQPIYCTEFYISEHKTFNSMMESSLVSLLVWRMNYLIPQSSLHSSLNPLGLAVKSSCLPLAYYFVWQPTLHNSLELQPVTVVLHETHLKLSCASPSLFLLSQTPNNRWICPWGTGRSIFASLGAQPCI